MRNPLRRRGNNPFNPTTQTDTSATGGQDAGATHDDAVAVLGTDMVAKLGEVVAATPGLLDATLSAVRPEDVEDETVTIVSLLLDNTLSAREYMAAIGQGHDEFLDALLPVLREGVTILVTCSTMDNNVLYPLTRLQDAPRFGRPALSGERAAENGMTYWHMSTRFNLIDHTPLRDCIKRQITAMLAEMVEWERPDVARKVNVITATLTDGLNNSGTTSPSELSDFVAEPEDGGYLTQVATFIGDANSPRFRKSLVRNIVWNLEPAAQSDLRYLELDDLVVKYDHLLPKGHADMDTESLLRWWFYEQGLAAEADRLWLPGSDPKAIRRAVGQMSQTAFQASVGAFREEEADDVDDTAAVVSQ
jgi:hypothetical protein